MSKYVFKNFDPRDDIPVKNKYSFKTLDNINLTGNLYYIDDYTFKAVIRSVDSWGIFTITVHNLSGEGKQDIILYNGDGNIHIGKYKTRVLLDKVIISPQKIPKVLFQTTESKHTDDFTEYNSTMSIIDANPEYTYIHFDSS